MPVILKKLPFRQAKYPKIWGTLPPDPIKVDHCVPWIHDSSFSAFMKVCCSRRKYFWDNAFPTTWFSTLSLLQFACQQMRIKYFLHCEKSVQIRSFFWSVFSHIRAIKNSVFQHFSPVLNWGNKISVPANN